MLKKGITILLLFIISIQCLPVKEIGKCLFDTSIVDDEFCEKEIEKKQTKETVKDIYCTTFDEVFLKINYKNIFLHSTFSILPAPIVDVTTPPPNA